MFASNAKVSASNNASNADSRGIDRRINGVEKIVGAEVCADDEASKVCAQKPQGRSQIIGMDKGLGMHQRWSRKAYNAYQRFYMQTVRAVKAGRAEFIK